MGLYVSPISNESLKNLCEQVGKNDHINPEDFSRFHVKRGLRNSDGTGVMAGLTKICSVEGYYISDGERIPKEGRLVYRGIDINDIIENCVKEDRFGYEETAWLLIFGSLPTPEQLKKFRDILAQCRELPEDFNEDMIMKAPSPDIMNKLARSVMALYSYDENPDDISIENVLRQCIQLIAQIPTIMTYAYQVKRRHYLHKSMYLHPINKEHSTAEFILNSLRADRKFTHEEAMLLDTCLIAHMEHGGGNNSTFSTRVLTSSGTDTYSAIAAGIGSLKGPKHGGAWAAGGGSNYGHCCGVRSHEPCAHGIQRRNLPDEHGGQHRDRRKAQRCPRRNIRRHHHPQPAGCTDTHEPDSKDSGRRGVRKVERWDVYGERKVRRSDGRHRSTATNNAPG